MTCVSPAGSAAVALDLSGTALEAGKIYDVFAVGLLNGTPKLGVHDHHTAARRGRRAHAHRHAEHRRHPCPR